MGAHVNIEVSMLARMFERRKTGYREIGYSIAVDFKSNPVQFVGIDFRKACDAEQFRRKEITDSTQPLVWMI